MGDTCFPVHSKVVAKKSGLLEKLLADFSCSDGATEAAHELRLFGAAGSCSPGAESKKRTRDSPGAAGLDESKLAVVSDPANFAGYL